MCNCTDIDNLWLDLESGGTFEDVLHINQLNYYKYLEDNDYPKHDERGRKYSLTCTSCLKKKYGVGATELGRLFDIVMNPSQADIELIDKAIEDEAV